jgi:KipI family sensor histidine kinase inhibitor
MLVQFADKPDEWARHKCRSMTEALQRKAPPCVVEFVPGYTTLLLRLDISSGETVQQLAAEVIAFLEHHAMAKVPPGRLQEIPVHYDGPDLSRVAELAGITVKQVIDFHTAPLYNVYLLGFSPGFPYLGELHHKLVTPRLATPRTRVPSGSVAIGGEHTGIYTVDSPGGWNIIGHTDLKVFDLHRAAPGREEDAFLLRPGDQVKFISI